MRIFIFFLSSSEKLRIVPSRKIFSGITFQVLPPSTCVMLKTFAFVADKFRLTIDCAAVIKFAAIKIGSVPVSGRDACELFPKNFISILSTLAIIAPLLIPIFPTSKNGIVCNPKIFLIFFNAPVSKIFNAPPGTSSPG